LPIIPPTAPHSSPSITRAVVTTGLDLCPTQGTKKKKKERKKERKKEKMKKKKKKKKRRETMAIETSYLKSK
jgi:hypothetical protein